MPAARRPLHRLLFALLAVVLGLLSLEGLLRLAGFRPLPVGPVTENAEILYQYSKFRSSPELIWELVPGWSGREGQGTVTVNSRGLRERDLAPTKDAGRLRILCLGDSVTFGHWVEAEEAFPRRLERILHLAGRPDVEVINAGVPGYSPFQELAWLESRGWDYQPDLIIIGFVLNDVVERYATVAAYGGASTILGVDTTVSLQPLSRLLRRTAFHRLVASMMGAQARRREVYSVRRLFDQPPSPAIEAAWQRTEVELEALQTAAAGRSVPLLLAAFPFRFQVAERLDPVPQRRLARWSAGRDIAYVNLTPEFDRLGAATAFLDHDHPTPAGHEAVARALAAQLLERRLLPAALAAARPGSGETASPRSTPAVLKAEAPP